MRIVFFGTPDYVLPILEAVHKKFSKREISPIVAVVTQPPRPSGREQRATYSPIDSWAFKKKIQIIYESKGILKENLKADLGILASYGSIIPKEIIDNFPYGIINVHPSLLPKWRGASPVQAPILSGETETGVSIIKLDEKLDHGPIVAQFKEDISEGDTTESLRTRLFARSADVLVELLDPYMKGKIKPREQKHKKASFTTQIKKVDAFITPEYLGKAINGQVIADKWEIPFAKDLTLTPNPYTLSAFIRAMFPWPVAWTFVNLNKKETSREKRLKILKAHIEENNLVIDTVQLEGKNPISWKQFTEAYKNYAFGV